MRHVACVLIGLIPLLLPRMAAAVAAEPMTVIQLLKEARVHKEVMGVMGYL